MGLFSYIEEAFKRSFDEKCVALLVAAYRTSIVNHIFLVDWMENDFTSMLVNYIDKDSRRLKWNIHCHREHHLHDDTNQTNKGFANKEDIIDMRLSSISFRQEYCFYVETKRLKEKDTGLLNRYIETGMDHYLTEKYPRGVLLGYLIEGNVDVTIQKINALLTKGTRTSEMLIRKEHSFHDQYFESTHPNFGVISHFVFDYTV